MNNEIIHGFRNKCILRMLLEKSFQLIVYRLKKSPVLVKQREGGKWTGRDNLLCTRQFAIPRQNCMALLNIKDPFLTVMDNESSNTHVGNCILHFQLFVPRWGPSMNDVSNQFLYNKLLLLKLNEYIRQINIFLN